MLPGLSFTPARQGGREPERAGPQIQASVHRFLWRRVKVCRRADLRHLWFLRGVVRELGLGTDATFAWASSFVSFAFAWFICIALDR
eukprot:209171-Pleurochrysis_carterae.AAC.1